MKFSETSGKTTNPGFKTLYRIYDPKNHKAFADLIALQGEKIDKPLKLTHEVERWKWTVLN